MHAPDPPHDADRVGIRHTSTRSARWPTATCTRPDGCGSARSATVGSPRSSATAAANGMRRSGPARRRGADGAGMSAVAEARGQHARRAPGHRTTDRRGRHRHHRARSRCGPGGPGSTRAGPCPRAAPRRHRMRRCLLGAGDRTPRRTSPHRGAGRAGVGRIGAGRSARRRHVCAAGSAPCSRRRRWNGRPSLPTRSSAVSPRASRHGTATPSATW